MRSDNGQFSFQAGSSMRKLLIGSLLIMAVLICFTSVANAEGPYAYVSNFGSNSVSVIDTQTDTVIATVPVGTAASHPTGVAVNPAGTTVYVSNREDGFVSVINAATNTVTTNVTVGTGPVGIAVSPDGSKIYVVNSGGNSVSVIDAGTNTVTATVPVGTNPWAAVVTPDGSKIYVTNRGTSNSVSVIDAATNTVTTTVPVGTSPYGVTANPAGTTVYVANNGGNSVSVIDAAANSVTATVPVGSSPWGIAVSPDGSTVYVTNSDGNSVSVIDAAANSVTATVPVGSSPIGVVTNPDGTMIYVANSGSGTVSVIAAATNTVTATVPVGSTPYAMGQFIVPPTPVPVASIDSPAVSPDGPAQLTINFRGSGTNSPTSWLWTFGSDGTSADQNPSHTFSTAGTYNVTLVASNAGGDSEPDSVIITVNTPTLAPTPVLPGLIWAKTFGGDRSNVGYSVLKMNDGYVVAGSMTPDGSDHTDLYLMKTDFSGNLLWNKTFGGDYSDEGRSLIAVSDGFVIAGTSWGDVGFSDVYLVKTDLNGNLVWEKRFGGEDDDTSSSVVAVSGGYVVAGTTWSSGSGSGDVYLVKTDLNGNLVWEKTFGGAYGEYGNSLAAVSDGFVIAGRTDTYGGGGDDLYLVKTNLTGAMSWNTTYGGEGDETGNSLVAGSDGYLIAGTVDLYDGTGNRDVLLLKTDLSGNQVWNRTYGGPERESGNSLASVNGGYVIVGDTNSYGNGSYDVYLVRTNSTGGFVFNATYGGPGGDTGYSVAPVGDGFVITGMTGELGPSGFSLADDVRIMRPSDSLLYLVKANPHFLSTEAPTPRPPPFTVPNPYQRGPYGDSIYPPDTNLSITGTPQPASPVPSPFPASPVPSPTQPVPTGIGATITPAPTTVVIPPSTPSTGLEGLIAMGLGTIIYGILRRKR